MNEAPESVQTIDNGQSCIRRESRHGGKLIDVRHGRYSELEDAGEYSERGLDLTTLHDPSDFLRVLRDAGLTDEELADAELDSDSEYDPREDPHYEEVSYRDDRFRCTWSNDDLLVVVGINPFTGYEGKPDRDEEYDEWFGLPARRDKIGYVGIEGRERAVEQFTNDLIEAAKYVKDAADERRYI